MSVEKEATAAYSLGVSVLTGGMEPREKPAQTTPDPGISRRMVTAPSTRITGTLLQTADPGHPTKPEPDLAGPAFASSSPNLRVTR